MNPPNTATAIRERIVIYAKFLADVLEIREHGGNNHGEVVEKLLRRAGGSPGQPWCAAFCDALYEAACKAFGVQPDINIGLSVSQLAQRGKELGRYHEDIDLCRPGDLVLIKGGPTGYQHVGVAVSFANDNKVIATIEGNTNSAGSADGDGVYRKRREGSGLAFVQL